MCVFVVSVYDAVVVSGGGYANVLALAATALPAVEVAVSRRRRRRRPVRGVRIRAVLRGVCEQHRDARSTNKGVSEHFEYILYTTSV